MTTGDGTSERACYKFPRPKGRGRTEEDAIAEWQREKREQFGERLPAVQGLPAILADEYGIYVTDVNPGNIMFDDG